jgi:hypothetical protein
MAALHGVSQVPGPVRSMRTAGLVGVPAWRWCHPRYAARAMATCSHQMARATQPFPGPRAAIERAPEVHLHLLGVSAEDIAAILARELPQPDVNRQKPPHVP